MRFGIPSALAVVALMTAGCGSAQASNLDPANDGHCTAVTYVFQKDAASNPKATAEQKRALSMTFEWYAARARANAAERDDVIGVMREMKPVLVAVAAEPEAARDELVACAKRAADDPSFAAALRKR